MTDGAIEVWASLPDEIRLDRTFVPFHQEHERRKSKLIFLKLNCDQSVEIFKKKYLKNLKLKQVACQ